MVKVTDFDVSQYLDNEELIAEYLSAGLGRESLYKAFAPGAKPRYETVQKVLGTLGVKVHVSAK